MNVLLIAVGTVLLWGTSRGVTNAMFRATRGWPMPVRAVVTVLAAAAATGGVVLLLASMRWRP